MAEPSVRHLLRSTAGRLAASVESPVVDAEVLVSHVLGWGRAELYARSDLAVPSRVIEDLEALVRRRCCGEPLQYLTGHQAFRHLDLAVGPGVLVPRPETEMVVEHALGRIGSLTGPIVVDVGTGSGAIALAIAAERPDAVVWATEVSASALEWATRNLAITGLGNVSLLMGDLLDPLPLSLQSGVDLVVANPPYLAAEQLGLTPPDVRDHEPLVALVSGPSGLEIPARVVWEAWAWLKPGGWLVMETWPGQVDALVSLLAASYHTVAAHPDLTGSLRIAEGRRPIA